MVGAVSRRFFSSSPGAQAVGFIGLGNMGASMASNLMSSGVTVAAFDLDKGAVNSLAEKGAAVAESLEDLKGVETIVTMLPSSPHVQSTVHTMLKAGWRGKVS